MDGSGTATPVARRRGPRRRLRLAGRAVAAVVVGLVAGVGVASPPALATADASSTVLRWNAVTVQAAAAACLSPGNPVGESRLYAMTQIAVHDALNAIHPRFTTYSPRLFAPADASADAAVAAATHTVALAVFGELRDSITDPCGARGAAVIERAYVAAISDVPEGAEKQAGLAIGRKAAVAIIENRRDDAATPPAEAVRPFDPTAATCVPRALAELKGDGVESGPASRNREARSTATQRHLGSWQQARLLALLNIAQADAVALGHACADTGEESLLGRYIPPVLSSTGKVIP